MFFYFHAVVTRCIEYISTTVTTLMQYLIPFSQRVYRLKAKCGTVHNTDLNISSEFPKFPLDEIPPKVKSQFSTECNRIEIIFDERASTEQRHIERNV